MSAADWRRGYCPVCGAWPALAESRGLARERRLRCGRCGSDWAFGELDCPFCRNTDHQRLGRLVLEDRPEGRRVETCLACKGFVKTLPTLSALPPEQVVLEDLATVDLDLAAIDRGFARPSKPAVVLDTRVVAREGP